MDNSKMKNKQKRQFLEGLKAMAESKGIEESTITDIIRDSFQMAYTKKLEDEYNVAKNNLFKIKQKDEIKLPPAQIRCDIDLKKGNIALFQQWTVKKEDNIEDDFIEISEDDPKVIEKGLKEGDVYEEEIDFTEFSRGVVDRFRNNFNQQIAKAERDSLMDTYREKIGEIVTGSVDKVDNHSIIVDLGRYHATLFEKEWIGREQFNVGDSIKVFIKGIGKDSKDSKNGSLVQISRACDGFLRKLFENEVHEIYDGTVIIKDVVRIAGVRSKVVVYSNDSNVDPSGACIGQNGARIQSIVSQLGNSREKIDIVAYHENRGLYLAECLRPGVVKGIRFDDENNSAIVVCEDDTEGAAIGNSGQNIILARRLLNLDEIIIKNETEAKEEGIDYIFLEVFEIEEKENERRRIRELALKEQEQKLKGVKDNKVEEEKHELFYSKDEDNEEDEFDDSQIEETPSIREESIEIPTIKEKEEVVFETPVETLKKKEETPIETREVTTTISLNDLEASLEKEKQQKQSDTNRKKKFKKDDNKEEKKEEIIKSTQKMDIYTEEELREFENEDEEYDDFDDDFSEYDDDEYYEDN